MFWQYYCRNILYSLFQTFLLLRFLYSTKLILHSTLASSLATFSRFTFPKNISLIKVFPQNNSEAELHNVNFFTQTKFWVQNFTPKTRNSRLICFCNKTRKSWSIQVVVGLVCYVRCPNGYIHRIWVECKCAWVKITPLKYRI